MGKQTNQDHQNKKPQRRIFKNFAEYWHFIKVLSQPQREIIGQSLSREERRSLFASFRRGGWNDLIMRNTCDQILDQIKHKTGVDLLEVRTKVVTGKPQLIQKGLWEYVNQCFVGNLDYEHYAYILDGIEAEDFDVDYVKLVPVH